MDLFGHSSGAVCSLGASLLVSNLRRLVLYEPPMTNTSEWLALSEKMDRWQAEGNVDAIFAAFIGGGASLPTDAVNKLKATPFGAAMFSWAHTLPRETHAMTRWSHNSARYSSVTAPTLYFKGCRDTGGPSAISGGPQGSHAELHDARNPQSGPFRARARRSGPCTDDPRVRSVLAAPQRHGVRAREHNRHVPTSYPVIVRFGGAVAGSPNPFGVARLSPACHFPEQAGARPGRGQVAGAVPSLSCTPRT
jgi:hypothetical protein